MKIIYIFVISIVFIKSFLLLKYNKIKGQLNQKTELSRKWSRVLFHTKEMPKKFWTEAMNTEVYLINWVYMRSGTKFAQYELWKGKKPSLSYLRVFGSQYCILYDREHLVKFDSKWYEGIFLGTHLTLESIVFTIRYKNC